LGGTRTLATGLRCIAVAVVGAFIGSAATYSCRSPANYAEIRIVNEATSPLELVELTEDRFGNRYLAEELSIGASVTFPVLAWGELGYRVRVVKPGGGELSAECYAESGYRVTHRVLADSIGFEAAAY
jgi:hypothetical protein